MNRLFKSENGVTLVELIATIVIISIILLGFVTFFAQGASYTEMNDDAVKGSNLARDVLEEIRDSDFSFPNYEKTFSSFNGTLEPTISLVEPNGIFKSNSDLQLRLTASPEEETNLIKIKVEIHEVSGKSITETYGYVGVD